MTGYEKYVQQTRQSAGYDQLQPTGEGASPQGSSLSRSDKSSKKEKERQRELEKEQEKQRKAEKEKREKQEKDRRERERKEKEKQEHERKKREKEREEERKRLEKNKQSEISPIRVGYEHAGSRDKVNKAHSKSSRSSRSDDDYQVKNRSCRSCVCSNRYVYRSVVIVVDICTNSLMMVRAPVNLLSVQYYFVCVIVFSLHTGY